MKTGQNRRKRDFFKIFYSSPLPYEAEVLHEEGTGQERFSQNRTGSKPRKPSWSLSRKCRPMMTRGNRKWLLRGPQ